MTPELIDQMEAAARNGNRYYPHARTILALIAAHREAVADIAALLTHIESSREAPCPICAVGDEPVLRGCCWVSDASAHHAECIMAQPHPGTALLEELAQVKTERDAAYEALRKEVGRKNEYGGWYCYGCSRYITKRYGQPGHAPDCITKKALEAGR